MRKRHAALASDADDMVGQFAQFCKTIRLTCPALATGCAGREPIEISALAP